MNQVLIKTKLKNAENEMFAYHGALYSVNRISMTSKIKIINR